MPIDITSLFCKLVEIPSPSGSELNVAKFIAKYLKANGIGSYMDNAGVNTDSNSGNLVVRLSGTGQTLMFIAHIDTVETGKTKIKPKVRNGVIQSSGSSILGADNKSAVAALIAALIDLKKHTTHANIYAVFSIREENGIMGVSYLKPEKKIDHVFVIDGSAPVGKFITRALGQVP
ncbi:MAG: M20/M25/M40 family metallo-hydrolase, partial [Candidatus Micrarchaeaceae archaeon]